MSKETLISRAMGFIPESTRQRVRSKAIDFIGQKFFEDGLTETGRDFFRAEIVKRIKRGEKIKLSQAAPVLDGYNFDDSNIEGLEVLKGIKGGVLLVGNHYCRGLLAGFAHEITIGSSIRKVRDEEVCWIQGSKNPITKKGQNPLTGPLHKLVSESVDSIFVPDGDTKKRALEKLEEGRIIGLFPEGRLSQVITKPDFGSGRIILGAVESDKPVVCVGTWVDGKDYYVSYALLDPKLVRTEEDIAKMAANLGNEKKLKRIIGQAVAELAMFEVSKLVPKKIRGRYNYHIPQCP